MLLVVAFSCINVFYFVLVVVVFLVDKGFHTLYRSVVLNIVNRSGEFIPTRVRKIGGRLHGANMSPKLILY